MNILFWYPFYTLVRKEVLRFFRLWTQTILPSLITTVLYFLIFGKFLEERIGSFHGIPYNQFIAPGLILMGVMNNAYNNVVSSLFTARLLRPIEELLVSPMSATEIVVGYTMGGLLRGMIVGLLVGVISLGFTAIPFAHPGLAFLTLFLTSSCFALAGFTNAVFARKFDDIALIPTFIITPLTYLGGVFYDAGTLSPFWQHVSHLNPIFYMINSFRYSLLGVSDTPIAWGLWLVTGFTVALFALNLWLFKQSSSIRG